MKCLDFEINPSRKGFGIKDGAARLTMNVLELIFLPRSIHLLHNDPIFQLTTRYHLVRPNPRLRKVEKHQQRNCERVNPSLSDRFGSNLVLVKKQEDKSPSKDRDFGKDHIALWKQLVI